MKTQLCVLSLLLAGSSAFAQSQPVVVMEGGGQGRVLLVGPESNGGQVELVEVSPQSAELPGPKSGEPWLGLSMIARRDGGERLEVVEVIPGAPASRAGVEVGDKLVRLGNRTIATHDELLEALRAAKPGKDLALVVERSRRVELGASSSGSGGAFLGVTAAAGKAAEGAAGATLASIEPDSAAARIEMRAGDRICALDGREIATFEELREAVSRARPGQQVELRIQRDLRVTPEPRPGATQERRRLAAPSAPGPQSRGPGQAGGVDQPEGGQFFWKTPRSGEGGRTAPAAPEAVPPVEVRPGQPAPGLGLQAPKAPKGPKAPKAPKSPKAPKAPGAPEAPRAPSAPKHPGAPGALGLPGAPGAQFGPGSGGSARELFGRVRPAPGARGAPAMRGPAAEELLAEIRALRAEVQALREEIGAIRAQREERRR